MRKLYGTSLFFCLFTILLPALAQEKSGQTFMKMGNVSLEDLKMNRYDKDTSASAVVLYEAGKSYFTMTPGAGLVLNFDRHVKIKILKKSGYSWADVEVPLYRTNYSDKELLMNLKGSTFILLDGNMECSKLTKESIFE